MIDGATSIVQEVGSPGRASSVTGLSWRSVLTRRSDVVLVVLAVVSAGAAVWVTLDARFLAYPGWLAAQKADFILGPIGVGLYWRHRRPDNRLGLLLIALGLCGVPYILTSSTNPTLFAVGVITEVPINVLTAAAILAFPTGQLDGLVTRTILLGLGVTLGVVYIALMLSSPRVSPSFSLSGCRAACPANGLAVWSPLSWAPQLVDVGRVSVIAAAAATMCVIGWRFATGTPPRRRSLSIGAPIGLLFLLSQATFQSLQLFTPSYASASAGPVRGAMDWTIAGARSAIWYGFLVALIAAELYAGRVLRRLVGSSLGRPSFRELEGMLRVPLGDPGLRLGFWRGDTSEWVDADGTRLAPGGPDQTATEVDRDGRPVVTVIHDRQLVDDPELLRAAGVVALLALENAELDAAWKESLHALGESRARLTRASDKERRKLERDLHDGAQQRLLAALIRLSSADELAGESPELKRQITSTRVELEAAIEELRDLARGIYPTVLSEVGLGGALRSLALRSPEGVTVRATNRRFAPETEAAFYYCCLEAVQNALKHAGQEATTSIRLFTADGELRLEVRDTGAGFDPSVPQAGVGLQNMQDRLGAVGGHVKVRSHPGRGTVVSASAPAGNHSHWSPTNVDW
jgi:signal transduction histidine kinase